MSAGGVNELVVGAPPFGDLVAGGLFVVALASGAPAFGVLPAAPAVAFRVLLAALAAAFGAPPFDDLVAGDLVAGDLPAVAVVVDDLHWWCSRRR